MSKRAGKLATRYARALIRVTETSKAIELSNQLLSVANLWKESKELRDVILNPMFDKTQRQAAFLSLANSMGVDTFLARFLEVVFERDRITFLPEIAEQFAELAAEQARNVAVHIKVAREISAEESRELELSLGQHIPGNLQFSWQIDENILGGVLVEYQGKILDGTLSGKLERMEKALLQQ